MKEKKVFFVCFLQLFSLDEMEDRESIRLLEMVINERKKQ
jgi:hypothetical protein